MSSGTVSVWFRETIAWSTWGMDGFYAFMCGIGFPHWTIISNPRTPRPRRLIGTLPHYSPISCWFINESRMDLNGLLVVDENDDQSSRRDVQCWFANPPESLLTSLAWLATWNLKGSSSQRPPGEHLTSVMLLKCHVSSHEHGKR